MEFMSHVLIKQVSYWDGRTKRFADEGCWFHVLSHLLTEQGSISHGLNDIAAETLLHTLVSGRGWSAYIRTIGVDNPCSIAAGRITTSKGLSSPNKVYIQRFWMDLSEARPM